MGKTMNDMDAWTRFSTEELRMKVAALRDLIDSGMLTDRSIDYQFTEIAIIENELAARDGR